MKKTTVLPLVAASLIALSACSGGTVESTPPAAEPVATVEPSAEPSQPPFGAETIQAAPTPQPPAESEAPDPDEPLIPSVSVQTQELNGRLSSGDGVVLVEWSAQLPSVVGANEEAAAVINSYFESQGSKLADYATAELFELAAAEQAKSPDGFIPFEVEMGYEVMYNGNDMLSIRRQATSCLFYSDREEDATTIYSETFNLQNGGLLIADDFFTVSEQEYKARLLKELVIDMEAGGGKSADFYGQLESGFDKDSFFITEKGITIYYQPGELEDAPVYGKYYLVEYDRIDDIMAIKP